jgi:hypothetical protein
LAIYRSGGLPNKELLLSADTLRCDLVALRICQQKGAAAEFRDVRQLPLTGCQVETALYFRDRARAGSGAYRLGISSEVV